MIKVNYATYQKPSDFMKFPEGISIIRILSPIFILKSHSMKTTRFVPLGECKGAGCEYCAKGFEPKVSYRCLVYDRQNRAVKVLEKGKGVGHDLTVFIQKNGDPGALGYDIEVTRSGATKETTKYQFVKLPPNELSEDDQKIIAAEKRYFVTKYFT